MNTTLATALSGALIASTLTLGAAVPGPATSQCAATFTPAEITAQQEPVQVEYMLSTPIGTITEAAAEAQSGVEVTEHDATARTLTLDVSGATAGEWDITLHGDAEATCVGTLQVGG